MADFGADFVMSIGGQPVQGERGIDVLNPATEAVIGRAPDASKADLDSAVAAAAAAFPAWKAAPIDERRAAIQGLGAILSEHAGEFARLLTMEQGKPLAKATEEVLGSAFWCQAVAQQEIPVTINEDTAERRSETRHVPLGVVAGIVPWNFPLFIALQKIAPALLTGNTLVMKPSPFTPLTLLKLGELAQRVFPAGVFNVVSGGDQLGPWMTEHPDVAKVSFTGSTATGRRVVASAASTLKRITLELGGNDAAIVLPDVDVAATAEKLFWSAFGNSGQVCIATKRLYVHRDVYDRIAAALVDYAAKVKVGDGLEQGTELGPIQNRLQYDRVRKLIADAKASGLTFLTGGEVPEGAGYFVPVSIVDNPPEDSAVVVEEAFGPVLPLLKFDDIEDVIRRANDSQYGLGGSVWTSDLEKGAEIAARLDTGTVWVNESQYIVPWATFGGHKQSGIGSENGPEGLLEFTNVQTISVKKA
jgi:acyl-CoA reductase-like NAD-dependent aldehyde dehydrogenase